MGADGPGKAEIEVSELVRSQVFSEEWKEPHPSITRDLAARVRVFIDDWEQASHGGEIAGAVSAGTLGRDDVAELGAVLAGRAPGRQSPDDVTLFDSTGLAIQDLAVALSAMERAEELDLPMIDL
jgi:ornithine cyclodeaminase/alanine dehydrogenase-like protein (mu-crystallin family)